LSQILKIANNRLGQDKRIINHTLSRPS